MHNGILVDGGDGKPDFRVWENMLVKAGIPQDKVQEIKNSKINIFNPSYPRAGVFVRYKDWAFLRTMKLCVTHKIPVWVWWEDGKQAWTPDPAVLDHVLTALELKNASVVARAEDAAAQRRHEEAVREEAAREKVVREEGAREDAAMGEMARSALPTAQKPPLPHPGARQKFGETPAQFLKRMEDNRLRRMSAETPVQKQRRESREQAQKNHPCPGRSSKAPLVFHWEEDIETGVRMRTQVYRDAVDQLWDSYSNKQRVFDEFHNEWDICTLFDPEAEYPGGDNYDDEDDGGDTFHMGDHADPIPNSPPSPPISNPSANALLPTSLPTASHDENDWPDMLFPVVFTCGLLDILYTRYGFLNPGPKSTTTYANNFDWNATRSILGLFSDAPLVRELLSIDNLGNGVQEAISHFIQCILRSDQTMPATLWDIHPQSPEPLAHNLCFHILKRKTGLENDGSSDGYIIRSADFSDGMEVVLHDAATVLQCYRQFDSLKDFLPFLFLNGMPFRTFVSQNRIPAPQPMCTKLLPTMGCYPKGYEPGLREYHYYEKLRKEFCNLPRARAALTRGSIIWRLALESMGVTAEEIVTNGPSQEVFSHGSHIEDPQTLNVLWDDQLSEEEKDLMCGVYRVFTGKEFYRNA